MNQSDIRRLAHFSGPELTVIFSVMSFAFYNREFHSKAMYRNFGSHVTRIVPARGSTSFIYNFYVSKNSFGGGVIKTMFLGNRLPRFSRFIFD